jgi:hypothetical protein
MDAGGQDGCSGTVGTVSIVAASLAVLALLAFAVSAVAILVQTSRHRSSGRWAATAGASLVLVFGGIANAVRGEDDMRYLATLLSVCIGAFLALSAGLLLERPLPALPFIAIAFVVANADLILALLTKGCRS